MPDGERPAAKGAVDKLPRARDVRKRTSNERRTEAVLDEKTGVDRLGRFQHQGRAFHLAVIGAIVAVVICSGSAIAASPKHPDWPCIQRLVPELSAGMVWAGPPVEKGQGWREHSDVATLATKLSARSTPLEEAKRAIAKFAKNLGQNKNQELTMLFAGTLDKINAERARVIDGIKHYSERQQGLADRIERRTAELNQIPENGAAEQRVKRDELEEQQYWDARIFEERQRSLTYICEQPVLLEQRLFALSREIMMYLD